MKLVWDLKYLNEIMIEIVFRIFLRRGIYNIAESCHKIINVQAEHWTAVNYSFNTALYNCLSGSIILVFFKKVSVDNYHIQNFNIFKFKRLNVLLKLLLAKFF